MSFSGIGVREMIFYQAAAWFAFDSATAVSVGVLFSLITAFVSIIGIIFHFQKQELQLSEKQDKTSILAKV